jgi:hypothetical protein
MKSWVKMITTLMMTKSLEKLILDYIYSCIVIVCSCTWNSTLLKWNIETLIKTDGLRGKLLPFPLYLPWMFVNYFTADQCFRSSLLLGLNHVAYPSHVHAPIVFSWDLSGLHSWMPCGRQLLIFSSHHFRRELSYWWMEGNSLSASDKLGALRSLKP